MLTSRTILWLSILAFIMLQLPIISHHWVDGVHQWRQADTAAVARNYFQESMSFGLPRVDNRHQYSGITGMEFPLYNYLIALGYQLLGFACTLIGKLFSLLCFIASFILLARCLRLQDNAQRLLLWLVMAFMPFCFNFSVLFMPEMFVLSLALCSYMSWSQYMHTMRWYWLMFAFLSLLLASLNRPYMIFFGWPILAYFLSALRRGGWCQAAYLSVFGLVFLGVFYGWYGYWVPLLNNQYGLSRYFYLGSDIKANLALMIQSPQILMGVLKTVAQPYLGWALIPFWLFGTWHIFTRESRIGLYDLRELYWIALAAMIVLPVIIGDHFIIHYYYLSAITPALVIGTFMGYRCLVQWQPLTGWIIILLVSAGLFSGQVHHYRADSQLVKLQHSMLTPISAGKLIVTPFGLNPVFLYALGAKGWSISLAGNTQNCQVQLGRIQSQGATAVLVEGQASFRLEKLTNSAIKKLCKTR